MNIVLAGLVCSLGASTAFGYGGAAAIVYNPQTQAWGSYHGANTRADAETQALANCGASCAGVDAATLESGQSNLKETWVTNGWVALSINGTGRWGTGGVHDNQADVENAAYNNCGGAVDNCYILRSTSSYVNAPDVDGDEPAPATASTTATN